MKKVRILFVLHGLVNSCCCCSIKALFHKSPYPKDECLIVVVDNVPVVGVSLSYVGFIMLTAIHFLIFQYSAYYYYYYYLHSPEEFQEHQQVVPSWMQLSFIENVADIYVARRFISKKHQQQRLHLIYCCYCFFFHLQLVYLQNQEKQCRQLHVYSHLCPYAFLRVR